MTKCENIKCVQQCIDIIDECMNREIVTPLHNGRYSDKGVEERLERIRVDGIRQKTEMDRKFSAHITRSLKQTSNDGVIVTVLKTLIAER